MGRAIRIYLAIIAVPFALVGMICASLIAWDGLNLRPWSDAAPDLDERNYPLAIRPIIVPAQLALGHAVVLAGTSTALRIDAPMLASLTDEGTAVNVSQAGQKAADGRALFLAAANSPGLRRLVLEIGEIWRRPYSGRSAFGQRTVDALSPKWWQMPEIDRDILQAMFADARGGTFYLEQWAEEGELLAPNASASLSDWQLEIIADAQQAIDRAAYPASVPTGTCERYSYLIETLDEVFALARQRDVQIDIIFPPMPFASYPHFWRTIGDSSGQVDLMHMQRCVVERAAQESPARVAVHAVHDDPAIVGDTNGMIDAFHYANPAKLELIVDTIKARSRLLTTANYAVHAETLNEGILDSARADSAN